MISSNSNFTVLVYKFLNKNFSTYIVHRELVKVYFIELKFKSFKAILAVTHLCIFRNLKHAIFQDFR